MEIPINFYVETCCVCGIQFAMATDFNNQLRKCKNSFYCPNGHSQSYMGESYKDTIERLEKEKKNLQTKNKHLELSRNSLKGQITKLKNK